MRVEPHLPFPYIVLRAQEIDSTQTLDLRGRSINNLELEQQQEEMPQRDVGGAGLVLIKSFKTGSTTLATYIAQVSYVCIYMSVGIILFELYMYFSK